MMNDALQGLNIMEKEKDSSLTMPNQRILHCSVQKEREWDLKAHEKDNNKSMKRKEEVA